VHGEEDVDGDDEAARAGGVRIQYCHTTG